MPRGVHVFDLIKDKHIDDGWVRSDVLGVTVDRYRRLRAERYLLTREEADKLIKAFKETYDIEPHELFTWDAEILPPGRRRRNSSVTGSAA